MKKDKIVSIKERENSSRKRKRYSKKSLFILCLLLIVVPFLVFGGIALFSSKKEVKITELDKKPKEKEEKPVETKKVKIVDLDSKSRPYAIMINNAPAARHLQSGLQDAYIIYEIIVEGGLTRYMALFLDQNTERIGSVRSARHYYLDYALENDAIYVHHGNSPQALRDFSKLGVDRIEINETKTGWRAKGLNVAYEHTLFTNIEKLGKGIGSKRTTRKKDLLLKYSVDPVDFTNIDNKEVANNVDILYSNSIKSSYEYDIEAKVYKRFVNGKAHKDYVTGEQYTFKNIITYQVGNYTLDDGENKGRQGLNNVGSGTGYYISDGYAIPIKWSKNSRSEKTIYTLEDGSELVVNDGNTFIQIQPKGRKLSIS